MQIIHALIIILAIVIAAYVFNVKVEYLSLSQFPDPVNSTCKRCKFYSCAGCGLVYYQEPNKLNQTCDCNRDPPSCYRQTLI